jgi:uncharacterized membrane protein
MAAGYLLGPVMQFEERTRQRVLFTLGAAVTLGFIILRSGNLYGDPAPWTPQETLLSTVLSFVNCQKYPPSLLFLMMTLGPALVCSLLRACVAFRPRLATFGRVPSSLCRPHLFDPRARRRHGLPERRLTKTPTIGLSLPGIILSLLVLVLLINLPLVR